MNEQNPDVLIDAHGNPVTELTDDTVLTVAQFRRLYLLSVSDRSKRPKDIAVEGLFGPFLGPEQAVRFQDVVQQEHPNWGPWIGIDAQRVAAPTREAVTDLYEGERRDGR